MSRLRDDRPWRRRAGRRQRWTVIIASFAGIELVGLVIIGVIVGILSWAGIGITADWRLWLTLALVTVPITILTNRPAQQDRDDEPWTLYTIRAVMVGEPDEWQLGWRIALALVFGPGLLGYGLVIVVQRALGLL